MSSRIIAANSWVERVRRLFETVDNLPTPDGPVLPQLRSLLFGSRMAEVALTSETCRIPREADFLWVLDYLRTQGDLDDLRCLETLLVDAGYGKWVSRSHVMALLRPPVEAWNHPAPVLGLSYSRFRLEEMIELTEDWGNNRLSNEVDVATKMESVRTKLETTQALEEKAARRRQVLQNGYRKTSAAKPRNPSSSR